MRLYTASSFTISWDVKYLERSDVSILSEDITLPAGRSAIDSSLPSGDDLAVVVVVVAEVVVVVVVSDPDEEAEEDEDEADNDVLESEED